MATNARIDAALEAGREDSRNGTVRTAPDGRPRTRWLAIGDPQAPFERFLAILDGHGALANDGRLRSDVHLVSMGDHFDWGDVAARTVAADSAESLLSWLAAHPPDQVTLIAGNHDLARVGELVGYDDASFAAVRAEADRIYTNGKCDPEAEARLLNGHPQMPSAECFARDFSTFRTRQRALVIELLTAKRFRLAHPAARDFLLSHAGVTEDELDVLHLPPAERDDAFALAAALNGALDAGFAAWRGDRPFALAGLHRPGAAGYGESRGMLFHRPSNPVHEDKSLFGGPPARRFDPRRLPQRLSQAIGHIRDRKARDLLRDWTDGARPDDGPLRLLETDGREVRYHAGTATRGGRLARVYFTDGGMSHADPARYELLDLATRAPASRAG